MNNTMTFHESYGNLPTNTLRLIRKHNVSPADFDELTDILGFAAYQPGGIIDWPVIDKHIIDNSTLGYYQPKFF